MAAVNFLATVLLIWLTNLNIEVVVGNKTLDSSWEQLHEVESDGPNFEYYYHYYDNETVDVVSLATDSLILVFDRVNLTWDDSQQSAHFESLDYLEMDECKLNPNSITFSKSLTDVELSETTFINGTLGDLLKSASNLIRLELFEMGQVDISKLFFPSYQMFFERLLSLEIVETKLKNETLYALLNEATGLQKLILRDAEALDISKLNLDQFGRNLKEFTIEGMELKHGTLYDLLHNARNLEILEIKDMDKLDISNWNFNHLTNQNTQILRLCRNFKIFVMENTQLTNGSLNDILRNTSSLEKLTLVDIVELDFLNHQMLGELWYLKIVNVTLINTTLYDILKRAINIQHLEFGQLIDIDLFALQELQIIERLDTLWISQTGFLNGNLYDLLKMVKGLQTLTIHNTGKVDLSKLNLDELESLTLENLTLTRSSEVRFQKLRNFYMKSCDTQDKSFFSKFARMFPNINHIDTGSKVIIPPKVFLSMLSSSATHFQFSFDFDPPVKTYEFGEAMKNLFAAGYTHGKLSDSIIKSQGYDLAVVQRVHYIVLHRQYFPNGTLANWSAVLDHTSMGRYNGTMDDIKPMETQAIIYSYFFILLVIISVGTAGNILSAVVLFKEKMKNSAGLILFALTFFDTGVILTYLISAYFNGELFYRMFVMTGSKSTEYTVDEHLWLTKQNSTVAYFVYPLNKTAYTGSVYATVLISLERFIAITWPLKSKYLLRRRNSKLGILSVLIFSVFLNLPRWIESYECNSYSEDSPNWNDYYKPTLLRMENYRTIYHGWVWVTFMYILPFIFVGFFNLKIFQKTKLSKQVRRNLQSGNLDQTRDDAEMASLTKMLLCVVGVFVICNALHIVIVFYFLATYEHIQLSTAEAVSCLPIVINCSVNCFIYILLGKTLRTEFFKLMPTCFRKFRSSH